MDTTRPTRSIDQLIADYGEECGVLVMRAAQDPNHPQHDLALSDPDEMVAGFVIETSPAFTKCLNLPLFALLAPHDESSSANWVLGDNPRVHLKIVDRLKRIVADLLIQSHMLQRALDSKADPPATPVAKARLLVQLTENNGSGTVQMQYRD